MDGDNIKGINVQMSTVVKWRLGDNIWFMTEMVGALRFGISKQYIYHSLVFIKHEAVRMICDITKWLYI